jgi:acyl-CoA reductase-like NAD-dependent aldehyde dehydrogenase
MASGPRTEIRLRSRTLKNNFIAGEWVGSEEAIENINPSDTRDIIDVFSSASTADVGRAIDAASTALPAWSISSPLKRFEALDAIGTEIIARQQELGDYLAREEGKTLDEAIAEAARAGHLFKFFAAEAYRSNSDGYISLRENVGLSVHREALGVVGVITPWNFPLAIPAWKIAPALAYGNTVVFKPAELVSGSAWLMTEIISRAGLPDGVFNLVMGRGSVVGQEIVSSSRVAGVTFTGSTPIGKSIGSVVFRRGGRVQLEMGGKNPLIVCGDADIDVAVDCALKGSFFSTGQRCTASSRLIVEESIHDEFVDKLVNRMSTLCIGDARSPETDIGPVASEAQLDVDLKYLKIGDNEGACRRFGGDLVQSDKPGHYLFPALFTETTNSMRINREEIFGPVAAVIRVSNFDEAIDVANDADVGLSAGVVTTSSAKVKEFVRRIEAGMAQANLPTAGMDFHAPFTGRKNSSFGPPEKGSYCREFFTHAKVVHEAQLPTANVV